MSKKNFLFYPLGRRAWDVRKRLVAMLGIEKFSSSDEKFTHTDWRFSDTILNTEGFGMSEFKRSERHVRKCSYDRFISLLCHTSIPKDQHFFLSIVLRHFYKNNYEPKPNSNSMIFFSIKKYSLLVSKFPNHCNQSRNLVHSSIVSNFQIPDRMGIRISRKISHLLFFPTLYIKISLILLWLPCLSSTHTFNALEQKH